MRPLVSANGFLNRVWNRDVVVGGDVHQLPKIVRAREIDVGQHERDLQGLLDSLLSVKSHDIVAHVLCRHEHTAGTEVARCTLEQQLCVLVPLRSRSGQRSEQDHPGPRPSSLHEALSSQLDQLLRNQDQDSLPAGAEAAHARTSRSSDCRRCLPSCLLIRRFHEKLDQGIELGSKVCKLSRTLRRRNFPSVVGSAKLAMWSGRSAWTIDVGAVCDGKD